MSDVLPVTGAGEADLSPGLENVGSESLNCWRQRPLLPSSEAKREDSLGRQRLDPLPAFTISLTHRDVEPGLEDVVDGDRTLDAILHHAPLIPAGMNPFHWNPQKSTGMGRNPQEWNWNGTGMDRNGQE